MFQRHDAASSYNTAAPHMDSLEDDGVCPNENVVFNYDRRHFCVCDVLIGISSVSIAYGVKVVVIYADPASEVDAASDCNANPRGKYYTRTAAVVADANEAAVPTLKDARVIQPHQIGLKTRIDFDLIAELKGAASRNPNNHAAVNAKVSSILTAGCKK
jgi:hypothetical protein